MIRAVIYARFSSHNQTEQSIEGQMHDCTDYAKKNDIKIVGNYIDRALSATTDNRPEFQRMIKESENRLFDVILVWKLDRFSRNRYDSATYKARLKRNGVTVISVMENISDSPEGILMESLLVGMAEYYSAELAQKINRGMRETALKCKVTGSLPLGYKKGPDGCYTIDEATAPIVRFVFEQYADGVSPKEIIQQLNLKGFKTKTGASFNKSSFNTMLTNKRYCGIYKYKDIETPGGIPPIVDADLFERVQSMVSRNRHSGASHKTKHEYLLTTKLFCGHCKSMMTGDSGTGKQGNVYYYYKCAKRKRGDRNCNKKNVKQDFIENLVINAIRNDVLKDEVIERIADKVMDIQNSEKSDGILEALEAKLNETENGISNIMKAIEAGIITNSTKSRLTELEAGKENIEYEIEKEKIKKPKFERDMIIFMLDSFRDGDPADTEYRKRLINTFINKIYLYDDKVLLIYNYSSKEADINEKELLDIVEGECSDTALSAPPMHDNLQQKVVVYFLYFSLFILILNKNCNFSIWLFFCAYESSTAKSEYATKHIQYN